jgi:aryl-alcohol dehydrogenase-like predicted oxidoreductase
LDQIPLYQFHRPDPAVPLEESIGTLLALKDEGKIRHIGLSNVNEDQLRRAQAMTPIVSIQNRYNPADRKSDSLVDLCEQEEMAFLPWAPIQNLDRSPALTDIAERYDATAHQIALAWLLARSDTMLTIPGTGSVDHLEENVTAAGLRLEPDEIAALNELG